MSRLAIQQSQDGSITITDLVSGATEVVEAAQDHRNDQVLESIILDDDSEETSRHNYVPA